MLGLGDYGSDDEESQHNAPLKESRSINVRLIQVLKDSHTNSMDIRLLRNRNKALQPPQNHRQVWLLSPYSKKTYVGLTTGSDGIARQQLPQQLAQDGQQPESVNAPKDAPLVGPAPGPQIASQRPTEDGSSDNVISDSAPASPYTAARQLIHSLTLPPTPNVAIPPSPPGSPRPSASAKFARFLELKAQGVHFNSKLSSSSQLKNPSLLQNLMDFAGIDESHGQYASTLPAELAPVPEGGFPAWAYGEVLSKTQQEVLKRKETEKARGKRDALDFVAASSAPSSQASTPRGGGRLGIKGSAAERVMAGLDREKSRSPHVSDDAGGHRKSRFDDRPGRRKSRSRSPKRRKDG